MHGLFEVFVQEMAPSNQGFVFLGGKSPPAMVLPKSTGGASLLGLTHNNYCRFFPRGYNSPAVLGTCGGKGAKCEV